jgi:hypothetical protein
LLADLALALAQDALALGQRLIALLQLLLLLLGRRLVDRAELFVVGLDAALEEQLERGQAEHGGAVAHVRGHRVIGVLGDLGHQPRPLLHLEVRERGRYDERELVRDRVVIHERQRQLAAVVEPVQLAGQQTCAQLGVRAGVDHAVHLHRAHAVIGIDEVNFLRSRLTGTTLVGRPGRRHHDRVVWRTPEFHRAKSSTACWPRRIAATIESQSDSCSNFIPT